ncbi:response regulator [Paenibacillaceae bacterium]|nr:response regulator [Paenibacillaceae bacterium]
MVWTSTVSREKELVFGFEFPIEKRGRSMLYKVMVVDDEPWGRKSISKMINELALGAEVVAEARHGEEALQLIFVSKPHIIVTDMNMPVMDGQRFLEILHKQYSEIKVVVISGHSRFEYMKAAVAFQACEYVLKPVSLADLKDAICKAIEASNNHVSLQKQQQSIHEIRKLRTEVFLQNVTGGRIANTMDIEAQSEELGIASAFGSYRLAVCMLRQYHHISRTKFHGNADLLMFCIENILYDVVQDSCLLAFKSDDKMRLCLLLPVERFHAVDIGNLLGLFRDAVSEVLHTDIVVGVSAVYAKLEQLPAAYREANRQLTSNPLFGNGLAVSWPASAAEPTADALRRPHDVSQAHAQSERPAIVEEISGEPAAYGVDGHNALLTVFELKALQQAMASGNAEAVVRQFHVFLHKAQSASSLSIRAGQHNLQKLIEVTAAELKGISRTSPALFDFRSVTDIVDGKRFTAYIAELTASITDFMNSKTATDSTEGIRDIIAYLDGHYFEDISLIDVATRHHIAPSYLSKLFKTVTGENFIEYVTRKRMEKACELLRSSEQKVNEIAELVGYENQRYFSQVFKKFTGVTPSEYKAEQKFEQ